MKKYLFFVLSLVLASCSTLQTAAPATEESKPLQVVSTPMPESTLVSLMQSRDVDVPMPPNDGSWIVYAPIADSGSIEYLIQAVTGNAYSIFGEFGLLVYHMDNNGQRVTMFKNKLGFDHRAFIMPACLPNFSSEDIVIVGTTTQINAFAQANYLEYNNHVVVVEGNAFEDGSREILAYGGCLYEPVRFTKTIDSDWSVK